MKKRILSVLLSAALFCSILSIPASAKSTTNSGKLGQETMTGALWTYKTSAKATTTRSGKAGGSASAKVYIVAKYGSDAQATNGTGTGANTASVTKNTYKSGKTYYTLDHANGTHNMSYNGYSKELTTYLSGY